MPDVKSRFEEMAFEVVANTGTEFAAFLDKEAARWKTVVEQGNITVE